MRRIGPIHRWAVCLCLCLGLAPRLAGQAPADAVGRIKVASGAASVVRGGQAIPAEVGATVLRLDVLRTGADGRLAVTLKDDTRVSLASNTEVGLAQFEYEPAAGRLSLVIRMLRGVMSFVSGHIAKLSPEAVRLETPTSVIGVRGTHALVRVDAQ